MHILPVQQESAYTSQLTIDTLTTDIRLFDFLFSPLNEGNIHIRRWHKIQRQMFMNVYYDQHLHN